MVMKGEKHCGLGEGLTMGSGHHTERKSCRIWKCLQVRPLGVELGLEVPSRFKVTESDHRYTGFSSLCQVKIVLSDSSSLPN